MTRRPRPKASSRRSYLRSAQNAFRHGLSIPVLEIPQLREAVSALATQIAGPRSNPHLMRRAQAAAEAEIDLRRIRDKRHQFITDLMRKMYYEPRNVTRSKLRLLRAVLTQNMADRDLPNEILDYLVASPEGSEKMALILEQEAKTLNSFERYERRALSRREREFRKLDATRVLLNSHCIKLIGCIFIITQFIIAIGRTTV